MENTKKKSDFELFRSFFWKEALLNNGLVNGVINGVIYYFITSGTTTQKDYLFGTLLSNIILGAILINLYPVMIRSKLKKNPNLKIPYTRENHIVATLYPQNTALVRIINIIVCIIISTIFTMGLIGCFCISSVSVIMGSILRGIDCAVFSVFAYYFSVVFYKTALKK